MFEANPGIVQPLISENVVSKNLYVLESYFLRRLRSNFDLREELSYCYS